MSAESKTKEIPHYHGHRDRLRERFVEGGEKALQNYELIELILFNFIPRKDVKPLAKKMLEHFGSLPAIMSASIEELQQIEGISKNCAIGLKAISAFSSRAMQQEFKNKPILNNWSRLMDYYYSTMANEKKEYFRILFLNKKNELIADEVQGSGTVDHTPAYPREVIKRALEHGATALILMHNHPSGDPKPSKADIDMTHQIMNAAAPLQIMVHDHIIVSRNGYTSLKNEGLI
ncbi:MAG: RadC family protein [Alphaproteobacteria bacterium]